MERPFPTKARHTHTPAERVRGRHTITIWPRSGEEEESSSHTRRQENKAAAFYDCFSFFPLSSLRDRGCHDIISSGQLSLARLAYSLGCLVSHMTGECGRQTARWWAGRGARWLFGCCLNAEPEGISGTLINLPPHSTIGDKGTRLSPWQMAAPRGCPRQTLSLFRPRGLMMRPLPLLPPRVSMT